jgi:hypothetical protein
VPQYYEQDSFFPRSRSRVDDQFGSINFGAQNDYGGGSLDDWQYQAEQNEPRRDPMGGFMESLRGAYGKTPALDTYRSYLGSAPKAEDYRPGKWDRLAAGLAGISTGLRDPAKGIETAMGMNRSKYDYALKDYYAQAAPLKEAAGLEHQAMSDRVKNLIDAQEQRQKYMDYVRNLNKDERDYLIATGKLKVEEGTLGLNRDKFGQDVYEFGQTNSREGKLADSLIDYRKGGLAVDRMNAGTQAANVNSMIGRRADQTFFDNMGLYGGGKNPSANDIGTAEQDVMRETAARYPSIIQYDAMQQNYGFVPPPPVGTPEYQVYQQVRGEVESRANMRARTGQVTFSDYGDAAGGGRMDFGGSYNPNPPPSLPNFGPSQSQRRGGNRYVRE